MKSVALRSVVTDREAPYLIVLHTAQAPDAEEWRNCIAAGEAAAATARGTLHAFVITDGGGPDSKQRKELAKAIAGLGVHLSAHVFTNSARVRGISTALRWMNLSTPDVYRPGEFAALCADVRVSPSHVLRECFALQAELPPIALLEQIAAAHLRGSH